jgi:hypothetical protein
MPFEASATNLALRVALDSNHDTFARSRGEEKRASRPDFIRPPAVGNPRLSRTHQDRTPICARRQLGELEELAAGVPHHEPRRRVDRRERIGCRATRVVAVAHVARDR